MPEIRIVRGLQPGASGAGFEVGVADCSRHGDNLRSGVIPLCRFFAVNGDNNVAVIDLKTWHVASRISTGAGPDGLAWVGLEK